LGPDHPQNEIELLTCPEIAKMNEYKSEVPKYEKIFDNEVKELVNIARKFKQNMNIKEDILKRKEKEEQAGAELCQAQFKLG
jgi:hypothetical protein